MHYTHHFAHRETLNRAASWLACLGFQPHQIQTHTTGVPWLSVAAEPDQMAEVRMLISAVERGDPDGFPGFWDMPKRSQADPGAAEPVAFERATTHATVIGWHPPDQASADDPELSAIRATMGPKLGLS